MGVLNWFFVAKESWRSLTLKPSTNESLAISLPEASTQILPLELWMSKARLTEQATASNPRVTAR